MVHVARFESVLWRTTSLLLVADGAAVAVDPGISTAEVAALADRAHELDAPVGDVLATHADWDHVCGIAAFPNARATMGERTAALVAGGGPAALMEERALQYGLELAGPPRVDRTLEGGIAARVGPFIVETLTLPGHTPDGTGYRVRALDLLVVGDYLSPVEFPFASSTADYRFTLAGLVDLLEHDPPTQVAPGHGPLLTAAEALEVARSDLAYLRELHAAVAGAVRRGEDARAAGLAVELPRVAPEELAGARAGNVEAQLEELLGTFA